MTHDRVHMHATLVFRSLDLAELPADEVSRALQRTMAQGVVHFSAKAQRHAFNQHRDSYLTCLPFLVEAVRKPAYVGQAPQHKGQGFELIYEIQTTKQLFLVAITLRPTNSGRYHVKSLYPISRTKLSNRIAKRTVVAVTAST